MTDDNLSHTERQAGESRTQAVESRYLANHAIVIDRRGNPHAQPGSGEMNNIVSIFSWCDDVQTTAGEL